MAWGAAFRNALNGVRAAALHTLRDGVVARGRQLGMAVAPVFTANEAFRDEQALTRGQSFPPAPWVINGHAARPINPAARGLVRRLEVGTAFGVLHWWSMFPGSGPDPSAPRLSWPLVPE